VISADTPPAWAYTVSVRSLCEFTAKAGDLDRRFTPSATALEGLAGQAAVVARRGPTFESEVPLQGQCGALRVRGRADGFDTLRQRLEEIKTIRGRTEDVAANRRALHWAQLETYAALLCASRGLEQLELALVYVDAGTQQETVLRRTASAASLQAAFEARCAAFAAWAALEAEHRAARDAALASLPFPPGSFRPGQRALAEAVYRRAAQGACLLAQAPTGIGKTLGTLYPVLRAMPGQQLDRVAFLTCKTTGRNTALDALQQLRSATAGRSLRVLALVAKEQACEHPGQPCHGDACPLARGFHDRLPAARAAAVAAGWLDPATQRRVALDHGICPYHLGQELLRWVDVVVGDVHHAFDPNGQLFGLAQALDWRWALLVDEAHNLVDRARQMYSAQMRLSDIQTAWDTAPSALRAPLQRWHKAAAALAAAADADDHALDSVPDPLLQALQALNTAVGEHLQDLPLASGPLLHFHFQALALQRLLDRFGPHSVFEVQRSAPPADGMPPDAVLAVRNIVPGAFLRQRWAACQGATLFSATLGPPAHPRDLLGLPADTGWIDIPPAFPPEHLQVRIARRMSTRFPHRRASLDAVVRLMASQFAQHPGNYLAFFSSFDYLDLAADRLAALHPALPQWRQTRGMQDAARQDFLARLQPGGHGIAFAVLGGAFAEGVDLPGTRLVGAFIATLGLPPVSIAQTRTRERLDSLFGPGHGYADRVPGLQRVVQAAGRVIRSPSDRGWLWLMDERYARPEVRALLPAWWRIEA
jgi:Rad3-related DNA helicase